MRTLRCCLAGTIALALFGGPGGAVLAQDGSDEQAFPTGTFVSVEDSHQLLEFDDDGSGSSRYVAHDWDEGATGAWDVALTYATDGDRYTELTADVPPDAGVDEPPTYRWHYDGGRLAFVELLGGDEMDCQRRVYRNNTYRPIEDPRMVVVAAADIEAGDPIPDWKIQLAFVAAAELGPRLYLEPELFLGSVPLAPIAKGEPITPELVTTAD
jgi:hypothetical protein